MDEKTELLVCLGAATAANCVPCFVYYFRKAGTAGVTEGEVQKAVELANKVKTGAGAVMRKSIEEITGRGWTTYQSQQGKTDHPCCN